MHPSHRPLWFAVGLSLAANVVLAVGYIRLAGRPVPTATPPPAKAAPYHDRIEAGEIVLRSPNGKPVATWAVLPEDRGDRGSHLRLLNPEGYSVMSIRSNGVDSVISWFSGDGHPYARIEGKTVNPIHGQLNFTLTDREFRDRLKIRGPSGPAIEIAK